MESAPPAAPARPSPRAPVEAVRADATVEALRAEPPVEALRAELRGVRAALEARRARDERLLQVELQAYEDRLLASPRHQEPGRLARFGHQMFSQHGEDGILAEIFRRIGVVDRTCVEIGIGNGLENNTAALLVQGWRGFWVEGDVRQATRASRTFAGAIADGRLAMARATVTAENVEAVLSALAVPAGVDLLSLDIDRNTYWVWRAITSVRPRVVVVEYNAQFPPGVDWVVAYRADRAWNGTAWFGASLSACERLGREKGYALVGCSLTGVNAFFVREDLCGQHFAAPFTAAHHFEPARYYLNRRTGHPASAGDGA
ncbi:MAG: hypothetical protein R2752_21365 [Vicinamibacterales bacterium]